MCNDSTGQFESEKYLEGASSLSAAQFEGPGTGILQHGSYAIGCKSTTQENSLVKKANTKRRVLYHVQVNELSYVVGSEKIRLMAHNFIFQ